MALPDKIYIHVGPHLGLLNTTIIKTDAPGEQEYIRKDALLKWINEARAMPHENAITRDLAFQEVVNYLNTM